jgi:ATP-dependent DNA helicase RecG
MPLRIENQNTEFKESWHEEHLKAVCAFANTDGGKIYIGVDDNGNIKVLEESTLRDLLETLPNKINNKLSIIASINEKEENNNKYIEIVVEPYTVPISYNGKYYIRSGSTTHELNGNSLAQFLQSKTGKTWDENYSVIYDALLINSDTVSKFTSLAKERIPSIAEERDLNQILEKLYLLNADKIKNAGILLFYGNPQSVFIQSKIKIGKFRTEADIETQDIIEGNLFNQVINSIGVLDNKYLKRIVLFEQGSIERKDVLEYPLDALREAILNAIVHKDYSINADIQIKIFEDKLVISNAGTLPPEIPLENLNKHHISIPRNPLIADIFQKAGYIEVWGRGTNKIVDTCVSAGLPEPEFKNENNVFTVILYKDRLTEKNLRQAGLNERQIVAVSYVKANQYITNKEYREINKVSDETARNELNDLIDKMIFTTKGRGRSYSYILK